MAELIFRKPSEMLYPPALRNGRRFAPLPDLVMYYKFANLALGTSNFKVWKCARGQCAVCQNMFTLVKEIKYRGRSVEENLICNECFERTKNVEFSHAVEKGQRPDRKREQSNGEERTTEGK